MLKGLSITPPVIGRISIGRVVEKNGKRLPEKDDQFTITSQVQTREGWLAHPFDEGLRKAQGGKIRMIPIRLLFSEADLNFRAEYTLFDRETGRPLCIGNGDTCKRQREEQVETLPCPTPDHCSVANQGCKPYGRLNVLIGDEDPLGSFVFRTTGFNSIRSLYARLHYFKAISQNRLATLPLELRLRGKSTRQSHGTPIYYVDITLRSGMTLEECLVEAKRFEDERQMAGFDQAALDQAARTGLANGIFEDSTDEASSVVEEFFSDVPVAPEEATASPATSDGSTGLTARLLAKPDLAEPKA